eukprot:409732-Hanusia_phi.AAC.1
MADQSPDEGHYDAARPNAEGSLGDAFFGARSADTARPELGIDSKGTTIHGGRTPLKMMSLAIRTTVERFSD